MAAPRGNELGDDVDVPAAVTITDFRDDDEGDLFQIHAAVVEDGGAFPRRPPAALETFRAVWLKGVATTQVARLGERVAGAYFLKPNFPGVAAHIANAGYLVAKDLRRHGIGRALAEHSLEEARRRGFDAMMFNLVVESNPSRRLWESLGFAEIGRIPNAIDGEAALIYWGAL